MMTLRVVLLLTAACFSFKAFGKDTGNTLFLAIYHNPHSLIGWLPSNPDSYKSNMALNYKENYKHVTRYWTSVASDYHTGNVTFHDKDNHWIQLSDAFGTPGGNAHTIAYRTSGRVEALTIDWLSQNVYWVDEGYNWIKVTNYSRGGPIATIVDTGLERPSGIACHPIKGYLFWTELGNKYPPKIERSSMSGANRTTLVTGLSKPRSIAVDITTNRIYWTDNSAADIKIESADLNGDNRRTEVSQPNSDRVFGSISVDENYIIVSVVSPALTHVLRYYSKSTRNSVVYQFPFSREIRVLDLCVTGPNIQPKPNTLPCDVHTCSHLCVSAANGKHECICKDNHVLFPNGTCSTDLNLWHPPRCIIGTTDAISMFHANVIHSSSVDKQQYIQGFLNRPSQIFTAVAVDIYSKLLFYAEDTKKSIGVVRTEAGQQPRIIHTYIDGRVDGMAVDWISLNVYWVDYLQNRLMVSSYDGLYQSTMLFNVVKPRAVAVDPNARLIFWTEQTSPSKVVSCNLDGTNRRDLTKTNLLYLSGIALDHAHRRIYFVGEDSTFIYTIDYDGIKHVRIGSSTNPAKDITLFQDFIIVAGSYRRQSGLIEAIHKNSGNHESRINVNTTIYAIETLDESVQPIVTPTTTPTMITTSHLSTPRHAESAATTTPTMITTSHLSTPRHAESAGSKLTSIIGGVCGAFALITVALVVIILLGKRHKRQQQSGNTHCFTTNNRNRYATQQSQYAEDNHIMVKEAPIYESSIGAYEGNQTIGEPYIALKHDHEFYNPNTVALYSKSEPPLVVNNPYNMCD